MEWIFSKSYSPEQQRFRDFYLTYKDGVYRYAIAHLKAEEQAEDVVQEAFAKIWLKIQKEEEPGNLPNYLFTVSRNLVYDEFRKRRVADHYLRELEVTYTELQDNIEHNLAFKEIYAIYQTAIEQLSQSRREIFLLSKEEFLSNKEIAERLGISINTVNNQMVNANKIIRQFILSQIGPSLALFIFLEIL